MFNWSALTLFLYIVMRMSGFVIFSPIFGRNGIPAFWQGAFIGILSLSVYSMQGRTVHVPDTIGEFTIRLLLELGMGFFISMLLRFFFFIPEQAGEIIDAQMGMSMGRSYDPGSQSNATVTANLLNLLATLLFFAAGGHITLLRLMITSGEAVPFGAAALGDLAASRMVELFAECALLSVKLSFPILGAELLGQVGMGVLMKAIPQINVFAINIELKVIVGMAMLLLLLSPITRFLLEAESVMLGAVRDMIALLSGNFSA